jgi:hypothetical protein
VAISSILTIDPVGGTASANIQLNGSQQIDLPVYSVSSNQIAFPGSLALVTLSATDFLSLLAVYNTFNIAIINNFSPSQFVTSPFSSITQIISDSGSVLISEFMPGSVPLFNYTCTYPTGNVVITIRALAKTLSYAQWLYFLYVMANFKLQVRNDYNI